MTRNKHFLLIFLFMIGVVSCGKFPLLVEDDKKITNEKKFYEESATGDFDSLLNQSKIEHKPVLLYFTGYACINNRKMEDYIFIYKDIHDLMHDKFIPQAYYVDAYSTKLDPPEQSLDGRKQLKTLGDKNSDFQQTMFKSNYQPQIVIVRSDKSIIAETGYMMSKRDFKDFLIKALKDF